MPRGRIPKLTPHDEELIVELYDPSKGKPLTLLELAIKFEVSVETIRRALKNNGVAAVHTRRERWLL